MKRLLLLAVLSSIVVNGNSQFNQYVPQIPVQAYREVATAKQKEYNENLKRIQEAVNDANYYLKKLQQLNDSVYREFATPFGNFIDELNNEKVDFAEYGDDIVNQIRKFTDAVKEAIKHEY
jgi:hypothetical protein